MKTITSEAYQLIREDIKRVCYNALVFALPAFAISLEQLIAGKGWNEIYPILTLWLLNTLLDLTRKLMQKTQYSF